jgi:hypothetical protein
MWDGDVAWLVWMLEFPVIALAADTLPAIGFESLEDIAAAHIV